MGDGLEEIDEAFNWLILVLTTLASTLVQFPQLYPSIFRPLEPEIPFMKLLLTPLILLIISWLSSHLIQNKRVRIVLKCFSWHYAMFVLGIDIYYLLGAFLPPDIYVSPLPLPLIIGTPNLIYLGLIRNRYKLIFPDSKFLRSSKKQVLFCAIMTIFAVLTPSLLGR